MDVNFFATNFSNPATLIPAILKEWRPKFELDAFKQYEPELHKINSPVYRPDRLVAEQKDDQGQTISPARIEYATRISLALQKIIVTRAVAFLTGGGMSIDGKPVNDAQEKLLQKVKDWCKLNKMRFKAGPLAEAVMSQLEAAEIWYSEVSPVTKTVVMRCKYYFPSKGYDLIPTFDNHGDLIAFSIQYEDTTARKRYLDMYTDKVLRRYVQDGRGWQLIDEVELPYGKIPVIYFSKPKSEWADVQTMIDRLELLMSQWGDTNQYHSSPMLVLKGLVNSLGEKGQSNRAVEVEPEGDVKYVTWDVEPSGLIAEKDALQENIFGLTQTPDLSFESMSGLGDISGVAFDRMLIDPHLKAIRAQEGWYGEGVQRRLNFLKAAAIAANPSLNAGQELEIEPSFSLYRINDEAELIKVAMSANGNKPVMTQKDSVQYVGLSDDPAQTVADILAQPTDNTQQ